MFAKIFICFLVVACVFGASVVRHQPAERAVGDSCPLFCTEEWAPLCGSDGKTYGNKCKFHAAHCRDPHLQLVHQGSCTGN